MPFAGDYMPPANPGEAQPYAMDFTPQLIGGDTISGTPTALLEVYQGSDPDVVSALSGAPIVAGGVISQWITGLKPCVVYRLTFTVATAQGKTLINYGHLACKAIA